MTQKELCYIEDLYNHEVLTSQVIMNYLEQLDSKDYEDFMNKLLNNYDKLISNLKKVLEGEY